MLRTLPGSQLSSVDSSVVDTVLFTMFDYFHIVIFVIFPRHSWVFLSYSESVYGSPLCAEDTALPGWPHGLLSAAVTLTTAPLIGVSRVSL